MRAVTSISLVVALTVLLAGRNLCLADTITLVNGKTMQGRVVRRDSESVVIVVQGGGRITIPCGRVLRVAAEAPSGPTSKGRTPAVGAKGVPGRTPKSAGKGIEKPERKVDPRVLARVAELIADIGAREGNEARKTREEARAALVEIGEDAVPGLCEALEDATEIRRWSAATVLGRIGSKRSVRALLAAVYAGTPPKGKKPAWWEQRYLRACAQSFMSVTGTRYDYDPDNVLGGKVAVQMLDWWVRNHKRYPVQIGEKLVEKTDEKGEKSMVRPDPLEEIKALPPRRYAGPVSKVRGAR